MSNRVLETWSWVLIFGGILLASLGLFTGRLDSGLGTGLTVSGVMGVIAGVVCIWVRSRRPSR